MERVNYIGFEARDLVRACFQDGLQRALGICHDPLPAKMAALVKALEDNEPGVPLVVK